MNEGLLRVAVSGIGLCGPGLPDWAAGGPLLAAAQGWISSPTAVPAPGLLPPAERRRAGAIVKLGLAVAEQACAQAPAIDRTGLATVFTASSGDGANCHAMCEVLATPERLVSPTRFTNSVHNAAAGYWHIAVASRAPSTSLCAHDASFGAGLLEAASQCVALQRPVLLVAADTPYPEPLHGARPLPDAFGAALLLTPVAADAPGPCIGLGLVAQPVSQLEDPGLEALRTAIPAARSLPLLQLLAQGAAGSCVIEFQRGLSLRVQVQPSCAEAARGPSAGPLPSRPAIPLRDRQVYPPAEGQT